MSAHPFRYLTAGTAVVVLLAVPLFSIKFGFPSDAAAPAGSTEQQAYDLIATQLGPGANGPLIVVVQVPASVARDVRRDVTADSQKIVADAQHLWRVLNHTKGIAHASIPSISSITRLGPQPADGSMPSLLAKIAVSAIAVPPIANSTDTHFPGTAGIITSANLRLVRRAARESQKPLEAQ